MLKRIPKYLYTSTWLRIWPFKVNAVSDSKGVVLLEMIVYLHLVGFSERVLCVQSDRMEHNGHAW